MSRLMKLATKLSLFDFGDIGDILRNTLFIRIGTIFLLFLNGVILARYLGAAILGVYVVAISIKRIVSIVLSFGFGSGVTYFSSKNYERGICTSSFLKLSVFFSLLPCVPILFSFNFLGLNSISFVFFIFGVLFFSFLDFCLKLARGVGKYKLTNGIEFLNQLMLISILLLLYFNSFDIDTLTSVIFAVTLSELISVLLILSFLSSTFTRNNGYKFKLKEIFSYSKWVYLSNSLNIAMSEIPNIVFKTLGFNSIYPSYYSRAQSLINIPRGVFTPLAQNLFFHFSSGKINKNKASAILMLSFVLSLCCSLVLFVLSSFLIVSIYGNDFEYASNYMKVLIVGMTFLPVTLLLSTWFSSQGFPKVNTVVSIFSLFIFCFSLLGLYISGADDFSIIYSLVIQQVSTALIYCWFFYRSDFS